MNVYGLFDKVANRYVSVTIEESDEMYVRNNLFGVLMDYPLNDVEFHQLGKFDETVGVILPCRPRMCNWECYKFPKSRADKLNFLDMSEIIEFAQNKKHEFLQKSKDKVSDLQHSIEIAEKEISKADSKSKQGKKRIKELRAFITDCQSEINNLNKINGVA